MGGMPQEWIIQKITGAVPKEIAEFMDQCFQICEIRAKVGQEKGIAFEVRTRETNHIVPHIHASYDSYMISIAIETGKVLAGNLPKKQQQYAVQWVLDHKQYLMGKWSNLAITAASRLTQSAMDFE